MNHSYSAMGVATSAPSLLAWTPGGVTFGGNMIQRFLPRMTAFQALVQLGSLWNELPDLAGPMMIHR